MCVNLCVLSPFSPLYHWYWGFGRNWRFVLSFLPASSQARKSLGRSGWHPLGWRMARGCCSFCLWLFLALAPSICPIKHSSFAQHAHLPTLPGGPQWCLLTITNLRQPVKWLRSLTCKAPGPHKVSQGPLGPEPRKSLKRVQKEAPDASGPGIPRVWKTVRPRVQKEPHLRRNFKLSRSSETCLDQQVLNPTPLDPTPATYQQAKTEVALQCSETYAAEVALQHSLFCTADIPFYKKLHCKKRKACIATSKKLRCRKVALSCRFPANFRLPHLGSHVWEKNLQGLKSWAWLIRFCRTVGVLQNLLKQSFYYVQCSAEPSCRNPKGSAEFWGTSGSPVRTGSFPPNV